MENEQAVLQLAYSLVQRGDQAAAVNTLKGPRWPGLEFSDSTIFVRRVAILCAWIANDNNPGLARRVATVGLASASNRREPFDADQLERLYWESWLRCDVLDDPEGADGLLNAATAISPPTDRFKLLRDRVTAIRKGSGR